MEDGGSPSIGILVFLVFVLIDALFYGFGAALQAINNKQVEERAQTGDKKAMKLKAMMDNPIPFINANQLSVTLMAIIIGFYEVRICSITIYRWMVSDAWPELTYRIPPVVLERGVLVIITAVFVYLLLSFGVLAPKKIAERRPESFAYGLVGLMNAVTTMLYPLTYLITKTSNFCVRILGMDPHSGPGVTEDEIISMVHEGHEQGVLEASEAEMITNIVEFGEKEAKDIMTHRKNIVAMENSQTLEEAYRFVVEQNKSRFPVYEEDIDNITGILHLKDVMVCYQKEEQRGLPISQVEGLVRPVVFIPETRNIDLLFKSMQSMKMHMVIVVDEYGQTEGLVAMEDILEEIVGSILDEYDEDEEQIEEQADGTYRMEGMTELEDIEELLGIEFAEEYETLNGFLISLLDRIPKDGEAFTVEYGGYLFHVLSVENKMIQEVSGEKIPETETTGEDE